MMTIRFTVTALAVFAFTVLAFTSADARSHHSHRQHASHHHYHHHSGKAVRQHRSWRAQRSYTAPGIRVQQSPLITTPLAILAQVPITIEAVLQAVFNPNHVQNYLWNVYQRTPRKVDSAGDFTWKDPTAAKRMKKSLPDYVIGGMHRDLQEALYHAGQAMDSVGIKWNILSAFRDDYRQHLASGFKAGDRTSRHGGSLAVGGGAKGEVIGGFSTAGYGKGQAIDIAGDGALKWIDRHGASVGLCRPMPGADPNHVQVCGRWHEAAAVLRKQREAAAVTYAEAE